MGAKFKNVFVRKLFVYQYWQAMFAKAKFLTKLSIIPLKALMSPCCNGNHTRNFLLLALIPSELSTSNTQDLCCFQYHWWGRRFCRPGSHLQNLIGMKGYALRWFWSFLAECQLLLWLMTFHHSYSRALQQNFWERMCNALSYNASNTLTAPGSAPQGWLAPSCSTVCRKLEACWMKGRWCDGQPLIPIGKLHNVDW